MGTCHTSGGITATLDAFAFELLKLYYIVEQIVLEPRSSCRGLGIGTTITMANALLPRAMWRISVRHYGGSKPRKVATLDESA